MSTLQNAISHPILCRTRSIHLPVDYIYGNWYRPPYANDRRGYAEPNEDGITVCRFPSHLINEPIETSEPTSRAKSYQSISFSVRILPFDPSDFKRLRGQQSLDQANIQTNDHEDQSISPGLLPCPLHLPPLDSTIMVSVISGKKALSSSAPICVSTRRIFNSIMPSVLGSYCKPGYMIWFSLNFPSIFTSRNDLKCELLNALKTVNMLRKQVTREEILTKPENSAQDIARRVPSIVAYKDELKKQIKDESQQIDPAKKKKKTGRMLPLEDVTLGLRSNWSESHHEDELSLTDQLSALDVHFNHPINRAVQSQTRTAHAALNGLLPPRIRRSVLRKLSGQSWPAISVNQSIRLLVKCLDERIAENPGEHSVMQRISEIAIWNKMIEDIHQSITSTKQ